MIWRERTVEIEQVPYRADWLSTGERETLRGTHGHLGSFVARILAKQLLAECDASIEHFSQIHIESRNGRDRSTRPQAYIKGRMIPWNISLSHSDRIVSSAVIPSGNGNIGIDLVDLASLSNDPLKYWLTFTEGKRAVDQLSMGILWSLKEAIYKATNDGNPFRPRLVDTAALLSHAEWSRINRDVETRGVTTGAMNNGWKLSLNVVDETIRALVWCPATRRLSRIPA